MPGPTMSPIFQAVSITDTAKALWRKKKSKQIVWKDILNIIIVGLMVQEGNYTIIVFISLLLKTICPL